MKVELTQGQIDGLVNVERVVVRPTVYGVGFNDVQFQIAINRKHIWQYQLWAGFLKRCFSEREKASSPAYRDVTCCDEWLSFGSFFEWVNKEVDYKGKPDGYQFDKDLVIKGNKIYSPEACSFVPTAVNSLLTDSGAARGEYPQGVNYHKHTGKFVVQLSVDGKQKHLGLFLTPEDAFAAYKTAKEAQIKIVATQYKAALKPAVFESLMIWSIEP